MPLHQKTTWSVPPRQQRVDKQPKKTHPNRAEGKNGDPKMIYNFISILIKDMTYVDN